MSSRRPKPTAAYGNGGTWPDPPPRRRQPMCWEHEPVPVHHVKTARNDPIPDGHIDYWRCARCGAALGKEKP